MKNKFLSCLLVVVLVFCLTACGGTGKTNEIPVVNITLWTDESRIEFLDELVSEFKELNKNEADIEYKIVPEAEDTCKETVLSDPHSAADIYSFVDDQLDELKAAGALLRIEENSDAVLEACGGKNSEAAKAVIRGLKMYGYPETAGNGYFLYYNKDYLSEDDVKTLDVILDKAEEAGKKFTMDFSSGWYLYSFFKGAGLKLDKSKSGEKNKCNWNATNTKPYKGIDVAKTILELAGREGFVSLGDEDFVKEVESGEVIAGINGAWNSDKIEKAWGDAYAATKLPTCTIKGDQVQMCSFKGYKIVGVNAHTKNPKWCMKLAEFITNEENQKKRFEKTGELPANVKAASSEEVNKSPAIAALKEQSEFGYVQHVAPSYWDATSAFGITLEANNRDLKDLQDLLDTMVEGINK